MNQQHHGDNVATPIKELMYIRDHVHF